MEFVQASPGSEVSFLLRRRHRVSKAAFSKSSERPTAQVHYDSFACDFDIGAGASITVVDDVITRGSTMLGAIALVQHTYPNAVVRGFSLIRTMSAEVLTELAQPTEGVIRLDGSGRTFRRP